MTDRLPIAELARRAGVTVRTVRYYVAEGVLPPPAGAGPHRTYGREHLVRLEAIRRLKERYFPLAEIRRALAGRSPEEVSALAATLTDHAGDAPTVRAVGTPLPESRHVSHTFVARLGQAERTDALPVGRAEGPDLGSAVHPAEATWRRIYLAPDVELHFRPSADLARSAAIRRLVEEAVRLLQGDADSSTDSRR